MRSEPRSEDEFARIMEILDQLPEDLTGLASKLSDPDHLVRMQAASKMGALDDPAALEPLLKALEDEHVEVRASAALSLGRLGDPRAVPALLDHLANDTGSKARLLSAWAANMIGTEPVTAALESALTDSDPRIRVTACSHFVRKKDMRAVEKIREMLGDPEPVWRSSAADMLIQLGLADERVMDVLTNDPSWTVRHSVAEELVRAGISDGRIVQTIERLMQQPEAEEYQAGVAAYDESMKLAELEEGEDELSEEDREELQGLEEELEDLRPRPLVELLEHARKLSRALELE